MLSARGGGGGWGEVEWNEAMYLEVCMSGSWYPGRPLKSVEWSGMRPGPCCGLCEAM